MARWRPRRTVKLFAHLQDTPCLPDRVPKGRRQEPRACDVEERWNLLHRHCVDQASHVRLGRLIHRLGHYDPGVQESALAELELATQLIRAGVRVTFLQESQARTADLECHLARSRFFVEVTAMVGSAARRRLPIRGIAEEADRGEEDRGVVLIHRIVARVQQKAKQLADYCDPVVLTISIPRADLRSGRHSRPEAIWLDLKALSGAVTVLLTKLRHLSAVMISLWDVEPLPSKAGTRLANVELVERTRHQRTHPRVRLLIENPYATAPLTAFQVEACLQTL